MQFAYDGQVKRYLTQFMRVMSNFGYKDAKGQIIKVPVRYGDMTRQVGAILKKNSENTIPSAPFIACYIKDLQFDRPRMQDPTFISKLQIRERAWDENGNEYLNMQGANYTVERIMPTPYIATFTADIWTTNLDQKLQIWEQLTVLFNPSLEIQTTDNYIDWTSLSVLERASETWSSRSIPQGLEQDIDILNMSFTSPIWITPPAKVKKLGIITKIITDIHAVAQGTIQTNYSDPNIVEFFGDTDARIVVTPGNFELLVMNNTATLIKQSGRGDEIDISQSQNIGSWARLLDMYPGKFSAGLSQLRMTTPENTEIVAYVSLNPSNESQLILNIDTDTIPSNTIISGRGTIDAIVNPEVFNPVSKVAGTRFLILEDININNATELVDYDGPDAWKNTDLTDFQAHANDIIEWDGSSWAIVFDSTGVTQTTYITNSYTGVQYKWEDNTWSKSIEGIYSSVLWRIIL
jgi:hypothetical protein